MKDWASALSILGAAFVGTVLLTIGLAAVVVPGALDSSTTGEAAPSGASANLTPPPVDQPPTAVGGRLTVSGDTDGTLELDRDEAELGYEVDEETSSARLEDGPYRLIGDDGRITFQVDPLVVEQLEFDGLSFYPEPDECSIAPGVLTQRSASRARGSGVRRSPKAVERES
jgi:hypothetical protein